MMAGNSVEVRLACPRQLSGQMSLLREEQVAAGLNSRYEL